MLFCLSNCICTGGFGGRRSHHTLIDIARLAGISPLDLALAFATLTWGTRHRIREGVITRHRPCLRWRKTGLFLYGENYLDLKS